MVEYVRVKEFADRTTAIGADVRQELDAISAAFSQVNDGLESSVHLPPGVSGALPVSPIARANKIIGFDVNGELQLQAGAGTWRGDWVTGRSYDVRDIFRDGVGTLGINNLYIVTKKHTSTTLVGDASNYELLIPVADLEDLEASAQAAVLAAQAARDKAHEWAESSGEPGGTGTKSAKSHAADSAVSASNSSSHATASAGSASAASSSASVALSQADIATTQAGIAADKAIEAAGYIQIAINLYNDIEQQIEDLEDEVATKTGAEELTNKTMTGFGYGEKIVTETTPELSIQGGNTQIWTLTGNSAPTHNLANGHHILLQVFNEDNYTVDWANAVDVWLTFDGLPPAMRNDMFTPLIIWATVGTVYGARVGNA